MKRIAVTSLALVASVGLAFATASALNPADLQHLEITGSCVDCDLSGAVLIHWKLRGADLAGAILSDQTSPIYTWLVQTCSGQSWERQTFYSSTSRMSFGLMGHAANGHLLEGARDDDINAAS